MGRIVFKTKDGSLIMNRESNPELWCDMFISLWLKQDAREKGVKVIEYTVDEKAGIINALVEWL